VNRKRNLTLLAALVALVMATGGCGVINKLRAKNALNEGVREFNKGKYDEAEKKFGEAVNLSPDLANAKLFHARTIYQLYDQQRTPEAAQKAIDAYQDIVDTSKDNPKLQDQALAFQADIYDKLTKQAEEKGDEGKAKAAEYRQKYHELLERRADLPGASDETKAAVYYSIGQSYWSDAFKATRSYINYDGTVKQQIPPEKVNVVKQVIPKSLDYLNRALQYNPNYADVWTIKKLALLQQSYVTTDGPQKQAIQKEADAAGKKAEDLRKQQADAANANAKAS
jgi:tetratricopeptide (TPR) repeat protein